MSAKDDKSIEKEVMIHFRAPADLKARFETACADNDRTISQMLRAAMRAYISQFEKPQGDLLSALQTPRKNKK